MTNREQIAFAIAYSEYDNSEVAEFLCDMIDAIGGSSYSLKEPLTKWLGLKCDEYNNWGILDEKDKPDFEDWSENE